MKYRRILLVSLLLLIGLGIYFVKIHAQQSPTGMEVHPSNFDLTISQGGTAKQTVTFGNLTDKDLTIRVDRRNFTAEGEEGGVEITQENTPFSLASWITVTPEVVTVPAHQNQTFTFTITSPANAEPGGHFGSLVFATIPPKNLSGNGAVLSQEISSLILVKVPGNAEEQATVQSLNSDKSFYEFGPANFILRIKNEGQVHIQPFGSIEVTDMLGNKFDAPLQTRNVLPNSIRRIPAVFSNKLLIGKYTARVIASYGAGNKPLYGSVDFYAFPVRYALAILGVLLILIFLRKRLGKAIKILMTGK